MKIIAFIIFFFFSSFSHCTWFPELKRDYRQRFPFSSSSSSSRFLRRSRRNGKTSFVSPLFYKIEIYVHIHAHVKYQRKQQTRRTKNISFFCIFFFFSSFCVRNPLRVNQSCPVTWLRVSFKSKASGIRAQRIVLPFLFNVKTKKRSSRRTYDTRRFEAR